MASKVIKIKSCQSTISIAGELYTKIYNDNKDFYQEKWATQLVLDIHKGILPKVVKFDTDKNTIITSYAGEKLETLYHEEIPVNIFIKIVGGMGVVWESPLTVTSRYSYHGSEFTKYMTDFLDIGYSDVLSSKGIDKKTIRRATSWMRDTVNVVVEDQVRTCLIHLDLSPRNILYLDREVKVIDWSRSIGGYRSFDLGIMFSKCRFHEASYKSRVKNYIERIGENYDSIIAISNIFDIYRKGKRINSEKDKEWMIKFINSLYD